MGLFSKKPAGPGCVPSPLPSMEEVERDIGILGPGSVTLAPRDKDEYWLGLGVRLAQAKSQRKGGER